MMTFCTISNAQCEGVVVEVFPVNPQTGVHNYFGVKVTLVHSYYQDITVNGYIYDDGDYNTNHPYSLTVVAGNLTAETSATFYETGPTISAEIETNSVSPCPSSLTSEAILSSMNSTELENLINQEDSVGLYSSFSPGASQMAGYVLWKYDEDIRDQVDSFPHLVVLTGLFLYGAENDIQGDTTSLNRYAPPDAWTCFNAALGTVFSIPTVIGLYNDFRSGRAIRGLIGTMKALGTNFFRAIVIGWAVVQLGDCLDWW